LTSIKRRDWLRMAVGGGAGLAIGDLLDLSTVRAATHKLGQRKSQMIHRNKVEEFLRCGCEHVKENFLITTTKRGPLLRRILRACKRDF